MVSSKHILLHFPGHHGNFLSRMFDFASGRSEPFDIFTNNGTAHNNKKTNPHKTFKNAHPGELLGEYDNEFALTGKDVSITYTTDFVYETVYLLFKANRDRGIDLLDDNQLHLATGLTLDNHENRNILVDPTAFENHWEWLIYQFHVVAELQQHHKPLDYSFSVHWIYSDNFENQLKHLLDFYGEEYKHSVAHHHAKFLKLRQPMLDTKGKVGSMFQNAYLAWQKQTPPTINPAIIGPRYKDSFKNH